MKFYFIVNPLSKVYKHGKLKVIEKILRNKKVDYYIKISEYAGHIEKISEKILGQNEENITIVAVGGDGTINETAKNMINKEIKLGIIPSGTANVFAKELNISLKPEKALEIILSQNIKRIYLSKADNLHFLFTCGIGFDGKIVHNTNLKLKQKIGKFAYILSGINVLKTIGSLDSFYVKIDGKLFKTKSIIVNKTKKYAGNYNLFKNTSLFDGSFEILLFKKLNRKIFLKFWLEFIRDNVSTCSEYIFLKGEHIEVMSDKPLDVQIDGESIGFLPSDIKISNDFINILC